MGKSFFAFREVNDRGETFVVIDGETEVITFQRKHLKINVGDPAYAYDS